MVYRTNERQVNLDFVGSTPRMQASIVLAKPQPAMQPISTMSRAFNTVTEKPIAPNIAAPPSEEMAEEPPYASPDSVEQMASVIDAPDLPLPSDSFNPEGFMRIKVFVNEEGSPDNVVLLESNFAEDYTSTLVSLFKSAKFSPGVSGGKAIRSWRIVEIDYSSA